MAQHRFTRVLTATFLGGVSAFGMASGAQASRVLFSSDPAISNTEFSPDSEIRTARGTTQIALDNGAIASFVDAAQFSVRSDGSLDVRSGTLTVVSPSGQNVQVHLPNNLIALLKGANASASFTAMPTGAHGNVISGSAVIANRNFASGSFWSALDGRSVSRVVANSATAAPEAGIVRSTQQDGIVASAENGVPVALGEALAAVGANGDIVSAAKRVEAYGQNPSLTTFPRGDYVALTAYAAQAASPYGGAAFRGAGADIVRTYFQYLATGAAPGSFQSGYARLLVNYLDLVRTGALPSGFTGATQAQLSAYIAFIGRTDGFGTLSATNQSLLNAYLSFLQSGGTPNTFATNASSLVGSYLDYIRGGGNPAQFTQASASIVSQYLTILQSGDIKNQLSTSNQALLVAYLANGNSIAFANTQATQLAAFVAYLNTGGLPSQYKAVTITALRANLQTLSDTGLFDRLLGSQATFLRSYLIYLNTGAAVDQFSQLPINVLTQQAGALNTYYTFIQNGGTPSLYTGLTQTQILAYLTGLQNAGLLSQLLGSSSSGFFGDYFAYLGTGGNPDIYAGLPNVDLNAYATQVQSFVTFLRAGNLPASYTALTADQIRAYINALSASGRLAALTGSDATFLSAYLTYLQGGGAPNAYSGLPIVTYQSYATALNLYFTFLNGGGLPSAYTALTQAQIQSYLNALQANGQTTALLGANASFFTSYLTFVSGGGSADSYTSLPIATYRSYATALNLYYTFLAGGGNPSAYTALTAAQIQSYLAALQANGQVTALLGVNATFFTSYLTYVQGGGAPDQYASLPGRSGGGGTPTPPPVMTANAPTGTGLYFIKSTFAPGTGTAVGANISAQTSGALSQWSAAGATEGRGFNTDHESGGIDGVVGWTRWSGGRVSGNSSDFYAPNGGAGLIWGTPPTAIPSSGTATYNLAGSTAPTLSDGTLAPGTVRSATLALAFTPVNFNTSYRLGFQTVINIGGNDYSLATAGGLAAPSVNVSILGGQFIGNFDGPYVNSGFAGSLLGPSAGYAGLRYYFFLPGEVSNRNVNGVIAFTRDVTGTALPAAITSSAPPPTARRTSGAPTGAGIYLAPSRASGDISVVAQADGRLETFVDGSITGFNRGTNTDHENGGIAGIIGWTRWAGGTGTGSANPLTSTDNGGQGYIWGIRPTAIPTSGTATYNMVGSTAVVEGNTLAPGSVQSATLGVNFATNRVGFEAVLAFPNVASTLTIQSQGGAAAPSSFLVTQGNNPGTFSNGLVGGGTFSGFLAGPGATYAGVTFTSDSSLRGGTPSGVIAFAKGP